MTTTTTPTAHTGPVGTTTAPVDDTNLALDILRARAEQDMPAPWDPETVAGCIRHITLRHPITGAAKSLGMTLKATRRLIQELGTSLRLEVEDSDTPQRGGSLVLFPVLPDLDKPMTKHFRKKALARYREILEADIPTMWDDALVGDEKAGDAAKRIRDHFAATSTPAEVLANRFLLRRVTIPVRMVSYPTMHAAWRLAQSNLLSDLATSDDTNPIIAANVISAYDALEAFREDSVQATRDLRRATADTPGIGLLAVRARPLLGGPVVRLENSLSIAAQASDSADFTNRALREFAHEVSEDRLPTTVADLNDGNILNAATTLGLPLDNPGTLLRNEVVAKIAELGAVDVDSTLVHLWNLAYAGNREDDFWGAVEKYANGDFEWHDQLK